MLAQAQAHPHAHRHCSLLRSLGPRPQPTHCHSITCPATSPYLCIPLTPPRPSPPVQPAPDVTQDPHVDPKKAKRIMANRLSAAKSKARKKEREQVGAGMGWRWECAELGGGWEGGRVFWLGGCTAGGC